MVSEVVQFFLVSLATAIVIFFILTLMGTTITYFRKRKKEKSVFHDIRSDFDLDSNLDDPEVMNSLNRIRAAAEFIANQSADTPKKKDIQRNTQNYYLPTAKKLARMYQSATAASNAVVDNFPDAVRARAQAKAGLEKIAEALERAETLFQKRRMFELDAELKVLDQKIQLDGLEESNF